jgi:uncharacterized membrane protein (DUF2068 family)
MKRSGGVTFSAVLLFIVSTFQILGGCLMLVGFSRMPRVPQTDIFHAMIYFIYAVAVLYTSVGIWEFATGVGLLRVRNWARISTIIFGGLLLFFSLPGLVAAPFLPLGTYDGLGGQGALVARIVLGTVYGLTCVLGGWWVYYFNKRAVKTQFGLTESPISPQTVPVNSIPAPVPTVSSLAPDARPIRPISITVISILLMVGACSAPMGLLVYRALSIQFPMLIAGFLIHGPAADVIFLVWSAATAVAGIGLWKLKLWGRTFAICVLTFGIVNTVGSLLHPAGVVSTEQMMAHMYDNILPAQFSGNFSSIYSRIFPISIWAGLAIGAISAAVELWFVVTRKQAFLDANPPRQTLS